MGEFPAASDDIGHWTDDVYASAVHSGVRTLWGRLRLSISTRPPETPSFRLFFCIRRLTLQSDDLQRSEL